MPGWCAQVTVSLAQALAVSFAQALEVPEPRAAQERLEGAVQEPVAQAGGRCLRCEVDSFIS